MKPCVSILIPTYNREAFIGECIESALNQTYKDFEIVIVDNASTDGTLSICESYAKRDARINVFQNASNVGPVRNWERCIELANGIYGKLLFSDDLMFPRFLSLTLPYIESNEIGFVSSAAVIGIAPESGSVYYDRVGEEILSTKEYFNRLASGFPAVPVSPGAALFRISDLQQNVVLDIPSATDHDFGANGAGPDVLMFALTARQYPRVAFVQEPLVFFRMHPDSFTIVNSSNKVIEGYSIALAWFFRSSSLTSDWAAWVSRIWLRMVLKERLLVGPGLVAARYAGTDSNKDRQLILQAACRAFWVKIRRSVKSFFRPARGVG